MPGAIYASLMWHVKEEESFYDADYVLVAGIHSTKVSGYQLLGTADHTASLMYVQKDLVRKDYTLPLREHLAMRAISPTMKSDQ